jgi:hypothetical protein
MKSIIFVVGLTVVLAIIIGFGLSIDYTFAVSGCCMQRKSYTQNWTRNRMDFVTCKRNNDKIDRDDVFNRSGLYWWDLSCK